MTTKRLNWTERRRIGRDQVRISLRTDTGRPTFAAHVATEELGLPPDARVVIEAYRQASWMRFDYGTVALPIEPASTWLEEFDPPEGLLFRVKVLGTGTLEGRILAEADQLKAVDPAEAESGRQSLLPTRGVSLGDEVWRLAIDDGAQPPELLVNKDLGVEWRTLARSPQFLWFVYPVILRQILAAVFEGDLPDPDNTEDWRTRWLRFAQLLPGTGNTPEEGASPEEKEIWIDGVVQAFCRNNRFRERFQPLLLAEDR